MKIIAGLMNYVQGIQNSSTGLVLGVRMTYLPPYNLSYPKYEVVAYEQLTPLNLDTLFRFLKSCDKIHDYIIFTSTNQSDINRAIKEIEAVSKSEEGFPVLV